MIDHILTLCLLTGVALITPQILPGVKVKGLGAAFLVALVFGILNFCIGWLLNLFLLPMACLPSILWFLVVPAIITIINTLLLRVTDMFLEPFELKGWWPALGMGFLFALAGFLADKIF